VWYHGFLLLFVSNPNASALGLPRLKPFRVSESLHKAVRNWAHVLAGILFRQKLFHLCVQVLCPDLQGVFCSQVKTRDTSTAFRPFVQISFEPFGNCSTTAYSTLPFASLVR